MSWGVKNLSNITHMVTMPMSHEYIGAKSCTKKLVYVIPEFRPETDMDGC